LDRTDGPAVEYPHGSKEWWRNGRLHREDGAAIETAHGFTIWHPAHFPSPRLKGQLERNLPLTFKELPSMQNYKAFASKEWWSRGEKLDS
jgi:hypothetical protein